MGNFLKDYIERRKADLHDRNDSSETAELLQSLNSNIGLVAGSTSEGEKTSKQILGSIQSQVSIERQRDAVYGQYTKEQLGAFAEFSANQKSQTDKLSTQLKELNALLKDVVGAQLKAADGKLSDIADYLKPDTTHSQRTDDARAHVARNQKAGGKSGDGKKGRSIVGDVIDLFSNGPDERRKRKDKPVGHPDQPGSREKKPSWWDKIRNKTADANVPDINLPDKVGPADPAKGGKGLKGLWNKIPGGVKVGGLLTAAMAVPALASTIMSDDPNVDKTKEVSKTVGSVAGGAGGWAAGAAAGGALGALGGPAAPITVPLGALIGGLAGGFGGSSVGEWAGDKGTDVVRTIGSVGSDAYHGAAHMASRGIDNVAGVGESIAKGFKTSVVPGFESVVSNFGRFTDSFETDALSLIKGFSKSLSEMGADVKASAGAAWAGAKSFAGKAANAAGNYADKAVQKVTGDSKATVGSVASSAKNKALNILGLGGTSAQFESGKAGTKAVGWDPTGGTSYGKYQIASKGGTAKEFLDFVKNSGGNDDIHSKLSESGFAKDTGSTRGAAVDAWKSLAGAQGSGERLSELEHKFIEQKKFMPAYNKAKDLGFNTDDKGVQDAIWSASVQHGKVNKEILGKVAGNNDLSKMSPEDQIKAIYARRSEYTDGLANVSKSAGRDRYEKEVKVALAKSSSGQEKSGAPVEAEARKELAKTYAESKPTEYSAKRSPVGKDSPAEVDVAKSTVASMAIKKEPQRMVDQATPVEAKPVQVANADQIAAKQQISSPGPSANSATSNTTNSTVPSLDSIPLQLTDMGLVLLNIGHV